MSNRLTNLIAIALLIFVFLITVFGMKDDSLTMDELAHLPAGYSYLTQKDMRLNPEHPPLVKDLAALPLLFINASASSAQERIKFPHDIREWKEDVNGQWGFGHYFLYKMGNPTEKIIFWARIPMVLILITLGIYLFKWTRELFGNKCALLALFLFSFSPTLLAHGRYVTTDVGAAVGIFIAIYYFLEALKNPSKKSIFFAGLSFGIAQLLKFTAILLVPLFGFLVFMYWAAKKDKFFQLLKTLIFIFLIGGVLICLVYCYHTLNYPAEKQSKDIEYLLSSHPIGLVMNSLSWLAKNPVLRPLAQYLFGLSMVSQRAIGGHTTYFLGEVSASGWRTYFPIVYIIKEPLTFHFLTALSLIFLAWKIKEPFWKNPIRRVLAWTENHFPEFSMLSFVFLYWASSLSSPLNIGVRHLLPVFPFTFLLVSKGAIDWLENSRPRLKCLVLMILLLWQAASVLSIYPHFLAYFNEVAGGPNKGYIYTVDSNLDWGQDLNRLKKWVEENNIEKIYVDYFGGSDTEFHLKDRYEGWSGTRDKKELPKGSYLAVSASFYQGGRGRPVKGFNQPHSYYLWLPEDYLVKKIGYSIFVFYIPNEREEYPQSYID